MKITAIDVMEGLLAEVERLTEERDRLVAQRDYYRRRWFARGVRFAFHTYFINERAGRPKPEVEALLRAQTDDSTALSSLPVREDRP
jgi:hypothetical protein